MNDNISLSQLESERFELVQRPAFQANRGATYHQSQIFLDLTNESSSDSDDGKSEPLNARRADKSFFQSEHLSAETQKKHIPTWQGYPATNRANTTQCSTSTPPRDKRSDALPTGGSSTLFPQKFPKESRSSAPPLPGTEPSSKEKPVGRPKKHFGEDTTLVSRPVYDNVVVAVPWTIYKDRNYVWGQKHRDSPFVQQLRQTTPPVWIRNDIDDDAPPDSFEFIGENRFCEGTAPLDPAARSGCSCRPDNGRQVGCEYRSCSCLEDTARREDGSPVGFPYHAVGKHKGCLRGIYLDERYPIYECNELCSCPPFCKNKVVQKGRQIPLEIFKTPNRGWGLRSTVALKKGQFIDTYRGEIITNQEADRREEVARAASDVAIVEGSEVSTVSKNSYLFELDKFADMLEPEDIYVVDGEYKGGPTRFLNHSCDPNVRQFTVSFYRGHPQVYELAFFAREDIDAFTELTFDYLDSDEPEVQLTDENIEQHERQMGIRATLCYCGSENCRRYLW